MSLLDLLAAQANRPDDLRGLIGTVDTVNGNRTIDVATLGSVVPSVPVADSYVTPTAGDVVFVVKMGSAWLALTTIGKVAGVPGGPNLVSNNGFEFGAVGGVPSEWSDFWSAGAAVGQVVIDSAKQHSGDYSLRMKLGASSSGTLQPTRAFPVSPGVQYRAGYWYQSTVAFPAGSQVALNIYTGQDDGGAAPFGDAITQVGAVTPSASVVNSWRYVEALFTVPAGHYFCRPMLRYDTSASGPSSGFVYFDDVSFRTV